MPLSEENNGVGSASAPTVGSGRMVLSDEVRFWHGADERALLELNKTMITLSTGGIGVSAALLRNEFLPTSYVEFSLLVISWTLLVLSIVFILRSYRSHRRTAALRIEFAEAVASGWISAEVESEIKESSPLTAENTIRGQWCFVIGIFFVIIYFGLVLLRSFA